MTVRMRLYLMMVLEIGIWGTYIPKLFPYIVALGFTPAQQAVIGAVGGISTIAGMFFTNQLADRYFASEKVMVVSHLAGAALLLVVSYAQSFLAFFVSFLAFSIIYTPTMTVANAIALANLRDPAREFGLVRMGGTVGWIIASWPMIFLLGEGASVADMRWIFITGAIASLVLAIFSFTLPHTPPRPPKVSTDRTAWLKALATLRNPMIAVLFIVTFIDSVVLAIYFITADLFMTQSAGIAGNLSMVVLSVAQFAEIIAMVALGRALTRLGWRKTMIIGILGHTIRFSLFAFFPHSVPLIIVAQLLHGVCYAFFFATLYIFIDDACPDDIKVSVQGIFNIVILGLGGMVAAMIVPYAIEALTVTVRTAAGPAQVIDFRTFYSLSGAVAAAGALLLAIGFRPPTRGPRAASGVDQAPPFEAAAGAEA